MTKDITSPTATPPAATITKSTPAFTNVNWPVITATTAKRKTIKLAASFTRLSPSRMASTRLGIFIFCSTDVAATASGGEIIAPNAKPSARVNPGMSAFETTATANDVKITNPNAKRVIGRLNDQKSFQDVFHAAAKSKGGKKIKNIRSGSRTMSKVVGKNPITTPQITRKIG